MKPSFDTWTSIFLLAAIQGIFISVIILFRDKPVKKERVILSLITFLFSYTLLEYVLIWTRYIYYFPRGIFISGSFTLLYGPLFYYYFKIIFENHSFRLKDLLSLLPFLSYLVMRFLIPVNLYRIFHFPVWAWLSILSMIIYAVIIYSSFKSISRIQEEITSWFNYLFFFYAGFIISFLSYYVLILTPFFALQYDYMISFAMSFFIYFISWFGYMQPSIFAGFTVKDSIKSSKYSKSALTEETSLIIVQKLQFVMDRDKLYKDENLNLEKLAGIINVSKHHLSQVINEKLNSSYFDYLNMLRVNEAVSILASTSKKEKNILEVAYETGFRNKATFNNAFKKITGTTPTEFREKQKYQLDV